MKGKTKMNFEIKTLWCWTSFIYLFIFLLLVSVSSAGSPETTTTTTTTTTAPITTATANETDNMTANQMPTAAKLVRFRRQPPITIIKHVIRSSKHSKPRRRIKRPKIRYRQPTYIYEDQPSYYKPHYTPSTLPEKPTFSLDDFSTLNLNAADFELPSSSYETQSMELDFYGHAAEKENSYQSISKAHSPSTEYSGQDIEPSIEPTYSYKSLPRKPHQKYGIPKNFEYSSDFNVHPGFYSSTDYSLYNAYQPESIDHSQTSSGSIQYQPTNTGKHSISTDLAHVPDEQYNFQSHSFQTEQQSTYNNEPVGPLNDYSLYNTKLSNTEYNPNYEPISPSIPPPPHPPAPSLPTPHPTQPISEIEITYSPSYEINLPPPIHTNEGVGQYDSIHPHIQPGNFAEPPEQHEPTSHYDTEQNVQSASIPVHVDYVPPSQELPLNPHHKQPAYDFPKSSYEVPIYDPIPFEAASNEEQEYYPPNQFEPHSPPPQPPSPPTTSRDSQSYENNYEPHLNINQHQQQRPSKDRTPQPPSDTHTLQTDASTTSTSTTKLRRNRKRQRRPLIGATKHILDVPELKEAFEAARPTKYSFYSKVNADTEVNASSFVEEKQKMVITKPNKGTENYFNQDWNPMRIRTTQDDSTPIAAASSIASKATSSSLPNKSEQTKQMRTQFRSRLRPLSTVTTTSSPSVMAITDKRQLAKKTSSVSIEKSQSKSYYDGTLAPSTTLDVSNMYNSRLKKFKAPIRQPSVPILSPTTIPATQKPYSDATTLKRTTKSIFDTTHFKAPQNNDWVDGGSTYQYPSFVELNLPKNHKLY